MRWVDLREGHKSVTITIVAEELGNSPRGILLEVKVVLAPDERNKGALKTEGVRQFDCGSTGVVVPTVSTNKLDGPVDRVTGVLVTIANFTGC